jgi:hypothetical protein
MSKTINTINFDQLAKEYCERQVQTPEGLREILMHQKQTYNPDGWILLECRMMDSSRCGSYTILPYGPKNTFKAVPEYPISPRGLASDMSVVVAVMPSSAL